MSKKNNAPVEYEQSQEEKEQEQYTIRKRELTIGRTRAALVRTQLLRAYEELENIRFDFVSDTAFREKVVVSKKGIEQALCDFLLDDQYWSRRLEMLQDLTPKDYWEIEHNDSQTTQVVK